MMIELSADMFSCGPMICLILIDLGLEGCVARSAPCPPAPVSSSYANLGRQRQSHPRFQFSHSTKTHQILRHILRTVLNN